MSREDKTLQQLIAEREKLDDMIKSYQTGNEELSAVVPVKETRPQPVTLQELMERSMREGGNEICTTIECINKTVYSPVYNYSPIVTVNVDYSRHETTNHESHTNTTLAGGDKMIDVLGGIFGKIFE